MCSAGSAASSFCDCGSGRKLLLWLQRGCDDYCCAVVKPAVAAVTKQVMAVVLLPENLHTYFELSAQAWTLYKAP